MGLQFASLFGEWLGHCCLLPEMEQKPGLVNPTAAAVVAAPAAVEKGAVA